MKEVSDEEFEALVQEIIAGTKTKPDVIKELQTSHRTFNDKVANLSLTNPTLYKQFVLKFPYRPKQYTHIDYEALIIYVTKKDMSLETAEDLFGVSDSTVRRKMPEIRKNNPRLAQLYRMVVEARMAQKELPPEILQEIDELEDREVITKSMTEDRKAELENVRNEVSDGKSEGKGKKTVASQKGVFKQTLQNQLKELKRIEVEEEER